MKKVETKHNNFRISIKKVVKQKLQYIAFLIFSIVFFQNTYAQCCDTSLVRTFFVDLSSTTDSVWISPDIGREGQCCGAPITQKCLQFIIITNPNSTEAAFGVASPPDPPGQYYTINCTDSTHMGQTACISGGDTVCIVYCKGGDDMSEYAITVSNTINASPDITVRQGCTASIWATGFDYIEWHSVSPGSYGAYDSYLDCQTCDTTNVTPQSGFPPYIDFEASGEVYSPCSMTDLKDTVRVYFVTDFFVDIQPDTPAVCYGGSTTSITANPTGGAPPYTYEWSTGETTQTIDVGGGVYYVTVSDTSVCPPVIDSVTVYQFSLPIQAHAGNDQTPCLSETSIDLNGSIDIAQGGIWSGGYGSFSPSDTSLAVTYIPTLSEINDSTVISLFLTTTGNWGCPADTDTLHINFLPDLIVDAGADELVCFNATSVELQGNILNGVPSGVWSTPNGNGSFFPDDTSLHTYYLPTATDTANGFVTIVLSSSPFYDCDPKTDTLRISFGQAPVVSFTPDNGCENQPILFQDQSTGAVTWLWDFGNGNSWNGQYPPPETYSSAGDYIVTLTVSDSLGCTKQQKDTVQIFPTPVSNFNYSTACEVQPMYFTDISTILNDSITGWYWNFGNGDTSFVQNPTITYSVTGNYSVELIVTSSNGCYDTSIMSLVVSPLPIIDIAASDTVGCNNLYVTFTNNTTGASSYYWDFGDGINSTTIAPTHTFINLTSNDINYLVQFVAYTNDGCSDSAGINILIHPTPIANFINDAIPGCSPLDVTFTNLSSGAVTYHWDFGDGDTSIITDPSHIFVNQDPFINYYNVVLVATSAYNCTDSTNQYITVFPNPQSEIIATPDTLCSSATVEFSTTLGQYSYEWFYGDGNSEFANATTWNTYYNYNLTDTIYFVQLITTTALNCKDTVGTTILVHATPVSQFQIDSTNGCTPLQVNLHNTSTGANSYLWDFGDGTTDTSSSVNISHTFYNNGNLPVTYIISLSAENSYGCESVYTASVVVYPSPHADFSMNDSIGCTPFTVDFSNLSIGANTFYWTFGDGNYSTNTNPTNTFTNSSSSDTVYIIQLVSISAYSCTDTAYNPVLIHPQPEALYGINESAGCSPFNISITNSSINAINYYWNFGDGDTLNSLNTNIVHTYIDTSGLPVTYQLQLIAENVFGCYDTVMQTIQVFPTVVSAFTSDTSGCSPLNANFLNQSIGGNIYEWSFGDGSSSNNFNTSHIFVNLDPFNIQQFTTTLVVTSLYNCVDSSQKTIFVYPVPQAIISANDIIGCSPFDGIIQNNSSGGTVFNWDFGDGSSDTTSATEFVHQFINTTTSTTTFNIVLNVGNDYGCSDTTSQVITVYPPVEALFYCDTVGCSPLKINFFNASSGVVSYYWSFGDGATSGEENPVHTYQNFTSNDMTYVVQLNVTSVYGCTDTFSRNILAYATPFPEFTATPTSQLYPSTVVNIGNQTTGSWSYLWDFGDGASSTLQYPFSHDYNNWGEFTITLYVSGNNCSDSISHTVIIFAPPPIALFDPDTAGCAPLVVHFQNYSQYADSYIWNFGDGGTSISKNPTYTFFNEGTYLITLKASGPGGENMAPERTITVYPTPIANFKPIPNTVVIPNQATTFYNLSENGLFYYWDFGDGTNSTEETPVHYYTNEGIYTVGLYVESIHGCKDTLIKENAVIAEADCDVIFPNAFAPENAHNSENRIFKPIYKGIVEYELQIYDQWGELIFVSKNPNEGWNGVFKGKPAKQDVYIWKATWTCINGKKFIKTGDVTLIK